MLFNQEIINKIQAILKEYGLLLQRQSEFQVEFSSQEIEIVLSHNPREKSNTLWVKEKHTHEIEIDNQVMSDVLNSNIKISNLPTEAFLNNVYLLFKESGHELLSAKESFVSKLTNYSEHRSSEYTENLIDKQNIEAAERAWKSQDYKEVINYLGKVNEKALTNSLKQKYKIANNKIK